MIIANNDSRRKTQLTGTVDGAPVEIRAATSFDYWVRTLDGSLIKINGPCGLIGMSNDGFVARERVTLDEAVCLCQPGLYSHDLEKMCPECLKANQERYPAENGLPF